MNGDRRRAEVELLLEEAAYRLRGALKETPEDGEDARIACENAHDAIEVSLNAVIVSSGERYRASHDLSQLVEVAEDAGETIPAELNPILELRAYTGGGRYSYRAAGKIERASRDDYDRIVDLAKKTYAWAQGRSRELCGARPPKEPTPGTASGKEPDPELKPIQPGGDPTVKGPPTRGIHDTGPRTGPSSERSPSNKSSGPRR